MTLAIQNLASWRLTILSALLFCFFEQAALAKDLGVHGEVFPIGEQNILAMIQDRLKRLEQSGRLEELQAAFVDRTVQSVSRPPAVGGLMVAHKPRTWLHDPTIEARHPIYDHEGRLIVEAGTRVNPLHRLPFTQKLIFVDGNREDQVAWAFKEAGQHRRPKVILVNGPVLEISEAYGSQVFFDQGGFLTRKFEIRAVPATVVQEGDQLRVTEVPLR